MARTDACWVAVALLSTLACGRSELRLPNAEDVGAGDAGAGDAGAGDVGAGDAGAGDVDAGGDRTERSQVLTVTADLDDGELDTTGTFGSGGYAPQGERNGWTYMGGYDQSAFPGEGLTVSFFRFRVINSIAAGSTVMEATLRLFGADTWSWSPATDYLWVAAEDSANPIQISSIADAPGRPGGRPITARVRWPETSPLNWEIGDWNESPGLVPLVQELVDRYAGVAADAHIQLFVFRDGGATHGEVAAEDWSNPAANHAELVLTWR